MGEFMKRLFYDSVLIFGSLIVGNTVGYYQYTNETQNKILTPVVETRLPADSPYLVTLGDVYKFVVPRDSREPSISVTTADMDGDGDLDIILADMKGGNGLVSIIENRIPQKKKE